VPAGHDALDSVGVEGVVASGVAQRLGDARDSDLLGQFEDPAHVVAGCGALLLTQVCHPVLSANSHPAFGPTVCRRVRLRAFGVGEHAHDKAANG
jgi:hypothetical protein